ncbi:uncharacterized protein LOC119577985 isoform X2 [Penaeus monodon]|uniref:uncharacterized protein LOC119577985 isoform X2 n=1 Tax=Penaeus monodon TaxID=6687 RepID=UPI0018A6DA4F|nr:uncharacterized protein LOC119577985 isoform X2 [Penaeus monodon]
MFRGSPTAVRPPSRTGELLPWLRSAEGSAPHLALCLRSHRFYFAPSNGLSSFPLTLGINNGQSQAHFSSHIALPHFPVALQGYRKRNDGGGEGRDAGMFLRERESRGNHRCGIPGRMKDVMAGSKC